MKHSRVSPELLDQRPPSDPEAERRYIGAVVVSRDILEQHPVAPQDFHTEALGRLCEHLQNYPVDGPVTAEGLSAWLSPADLKAVGGKGFIAEAVQSVGHVAHAGLFAKRIRTAAVKRRMILKLGDALRHCYDSEDNVAALVGEITTGLESLDTGGEERFHLMSMAELDAADFSADYVVKGVLAVGEPCVIGGMFKTLKTSSALDLMLSLGTGLDYLGRFPVLRRARAVYFLGEGRGKFGQDACRRIAKQKGITLSEVDGIRLCMELPNLDNGGDLHEVARVIKRHQAEFAFFDPLYLGLGDAGNQASNVFVIGQRLAAVQRTCQGAGATPIIIHHLKKGRAETDLATLSDLSQAGAAEFAGQWLLLNRTRPYDETDPGVHDLRLAVGSRLGHSSAWGLRIEEGTPEGVYGRFWCPEVTPWVDTVKAEREAAANRKKAQEAAALEENREAVINAMAKLGREVRSEIRTLAGLGHGQRFDQAWSSLLMDNTIVKDGTIKRGNGQSYDAFILASED